MNKEEFITGSVIEKFLRYDPENGQFVWKRMPNGRLCAGTIAGAEDKKGYIRISIFRRVLLAHRLAWVYMTGEWPKGDLDHTNRDKSDNRICNLREATRSQNSANRGFNKNNTSGFKGVKFHNKTKKWQANINKDRVRYFLGLFDTPSLAHDAYCKKADELFGKFGGK